MSPGEPPRQRVPPAVDLPPLPPGFEPRCELTDPLPDEVTPTRSPRETTFLGSVEWAWSPGSHRLESYYLHFRPSDVLLWRRWHDYTGYDWRWTWDLYAHAQAGNVDPRDAAMHLLATAWRTEAERYRLGHFRWVAQEGLLSAAELATVGAVVWGGEAPDLDIPRG